MGYYTDYRIEVLEGDSDLIADIVSEIKEIADAIDENGDTLERCKWYSHQNDLREFSSKHPSALFKLSGEGEDPGDIWIEYYQNGKMQFCGVILTFPDFDADLLK